MGTKTMKSDENISCAFHLHFPLYSPSFTPSTTVLTCFYCHGDPITDSQVNDLCAIQNSICWNEMETSCV